MEMIPKGITGAVLHVPDQHVVPVYQVKGSVRGEFHIHRAEVAILAAYEIHPVLTGVAGGALIERVDFGPEKSNGVVDKPVSLHGVWKMTAGDKLQTRGRTNAVGFLNEVSGIWSEIPIGHRNGSWNHPPHVGVGGVGKENLSPGIDGCSPRIRDG